VTDETGHWKELESRRNAPLSGLSARSRSPVGAPAASLSAGVATSSQQTYLFSSHRAASGSAEGFILSQSAGAPAASAAPVAAAGLTKQHAAALASVRQPGAPAGTSLFSMQFTTLSAQSAHIQKAAVQMQPLQVPQTLGLAEAQRPAAKVLIRNQSIESLSQKFEGIQLQQRQSPPLTVQSTVSTEPVEATHAEQVSRHIDVAAAERTCEQPVLPVQKVQTVQTDRSADTPHSELPEQPAGAAAAAQSAEGPPSGTDTETDTDESNTEDAAAL